jgi:hypothetical protein
VKAKDRRQLDRGRTESEKEMRGRRPIRRSRGSINVLASIRRAHEAMERAEDAMDIAEAAAKTARKAADDARTNYVLARQEVSRLETRFGKLSDRERIRAFDATNPRAGGGRSEASSWHRHSSIVREVAVIRGKKDQIIRRRPN